MRSLAVVTAGLSTPSSTRKLADALSEATEAHITARGEGVEVQVIELRELATELAAAMVNWGADTPNLDAAKRALSTADGLIAVTPAFQGSYSGLFKMFFDTLTPHALEGLPTLIAATGGSSRHALMLDYSLRPLFNYLHAVVVPTGIYQATEDYGTQHGASTNERIGVAAGQLADLMVAPTDRVGGLSGINPTDQAPRKTGLDLEEDLIDFGSLLAGHDGTASDSDRG